MTYLIESNNRTKNRTQTKFQYFKAITEATIEAKLKELVQFIPKYKYSVQLRAFRKYLEALYIYFPAIIIHKPNHKLLHFYIYWYEHCSSESKSNRSMITLSRASFLTLECILFLLNFSHVLTQHMIFLLFSRMLHDLISISMTFL